MYGWVLKPTLYTSFYELKQEHLFEIKDQIAVHTLIFLYAYKPTTFMAELECRNKELEILCYRIIIGISYIDHITNDAVWDTIR